MRHRSQVVREELLLDLAARTRLPRRLGLLPAGVGRAHSARSLFWTILMVLVVATNLVIQIIHPSPILISLDMATTLAKICVWISLNFTVFALPVLTFFQQRSLNFIISNLTAFKEKFKKKSIRLSADSCFKASITFDLYIIVVMILDMANGVKALTDLSCLFVYYHNTILLNEAQSQFTWFAFNIAEAYRDLRKSVDCVLSYREFENLIKYHLTLSECCRELNNAYSMQFLFCFSTIFIAFMDGFFTVIIGILRNNDKVVVAVCAIWVVNNLAICCRIISVCESLKKEAKTFDDAVYEKIIQSQAKNVTQPIAALTVFLHFLSKESVTFTMYKFTEIDWSLLFSLVAGGITYLVFLIDVEMK